MTEKSFFFNAMVKESLKTETNPEGYDRVINADDISDWQSSFFDTGVVKNGLSITPVGGMVVNVNIGRAAIKGKGYANTTTKSITIDAADATARYDMIVLRYNNVQSTADTSRKITAEYKKGTNAVPTVNSLTRNTTVYELLLGYVLVSASATSVTTVYDTRGDADLCPWFTPVKGYDDYYDAIIQKHEYNTTLSSAGTTVITDLASSLYNSNYSLVEVYTNGLKEPETAYTVSTSGGYISITFTASKSAGAKITVILNNFLDGEGMSTALAQYTQLLADVENLNAATEFDYICNGVNDNVLISNIVRTFFSVDDYKRLKLNIIGNVGMTAPAQGDGTTSTPYSWFNFTKQVTTSRLITLDFTNASGMTPTLEDGKSYYFFKAEDIHVIGASIIVNNTATNTNVKVFGTTSGRVEAENCRFWVTAYYNSLIASTGTFKNCRGSVANAASNSYCFNVASAGILRLYGGEWYAYTGDSSGISGVVGQSGADAVSILYGVNAPEVARSGYLQTNSIYQTATGGMVNCTDLISVLTLDVKTGISNVRGTIAKNKPNLM